MLQAELNYRILICIWVLSILWRFILFSLHVLHQLHFQKRLFVSSSNIQQNTQWVVSTLEVGDCIYANQLLPKKTGKEKMES